MTLEELLRMPLLKGARVLAGAEGTAHDVTWCAPDTRLKLGSNVAAGVMLLWTGSVTTRSFAEFVLELLPHSPSAVVCGGGEADFEPAADDLALCELYGLPLVRMPGPLNVLAFSKRFASVIAKNFNERQRAEEWLRALCYSGSYFSAETPDTILGYAPGAQYRCLYLRNRDLERKGRVQAEMETGIALDLIDRELSRTEARCLSFDERGMYVVSFAPVPAGVAKKDFDDRARSAVARLRKLTNIKWLGSMGTPAHNLGEFHQSFSDAVRTSEVVGALGAHEAVSLYDDWYMHMLLLQEPKAELREHMNHVLAPILGNDELVETLASYLTFGESLKVTSEHMFIHVNTLKYRLARIQELLRCDLKDPNTRFRLRMAITIERYLRSV